MKSQRQNLIELSLKPQRYASIKVIKKVIRNDFWSKIIGSNFLEPYENRQLKCAIFVSYSHLTIFFAINSTIKHLNVYNNLLDSKDSINTVNSEYKIEVDNR